MSVEYPYQVQTNIPELQYEEFNDAKFGYMFWPVHPTKIDKNDNHNQSEGSVEKEDQDQDGEKVKGRVLLIHGFGEYTKIQFRLMDHLSMNGFESFTFDQRGAGVTSPGKLKGLTDEYHTFNDLDFFIDRNLTDCESKGIPLFLWGHSMGGGICLNYSIQGKYKDRIAGYIGSGPLIILHPHTRPNKLTRMMSPMLASCLPKFKIDTGLDLDGITSDEKYKEFLKNDKPMSVPLVGSFRQISDFMKRGEKLYKNQDNLIQNKCVKDKPFFIQHGQADTINDPKGSIKFIDDCPAVDKTLKLYPNMRHSILSLEKDENFDIVFNDLIEWLNSHL